jgi:hypothetical protein
MFMFISYFNARDWQRGLAFDIAAFKMRPSAG